MTLEFCFYLYNKTTFIYIVPEFQISKQVERNSQNKNYVYDLETKFVRLLNMTFKLTDALHFYQTV